MSPTPPLPSLQVPLPSLFRYQQAPPTQPRDETDAPLGPPLRGADSPERCEGATATTTVHENDIRYTTKRSRNMSRGTPSRLENERQSEVSKAKKPASVLKREEREDLAEDERALEAEIERLRVRAGLPTNGDKNTIYDTRTLSADIEEKIHQNGRFLGRLDSMITNKLLLPTVNPMSSFIHLLDDMTQRRVILRGMQQLKLQRGLEVAVHRLHHLDHTIPYLSEEKFTGVTGEYHYHRFAITQLPNFKTVRQLYDTYVQFMYDLDVNVTDMFGQLAVREETEEFDPTIWNQRIITVADDVGCTEELNIVGFAQYYEHSQHTDSPMGLIVFDTVNVDDLYPYVPEERTCKDYQAANMICEVRQPGTNATVVVLKQCGFVVQLVPQFPIEPYVLKRLQDSTPRWPNALLQFLREFVVPEGSACEDSEED